MSLEMRITGLWSLDDLFAPGAMEDVIVTFLPSGEGWLYFAHPCQNIVEKFKWVIDERDLLHIKGTTTTMFYDVEEGDELALDSFFDERSDLEILDVKVDIKKEITPRGENEVITFSKPLWFTDNKFALVHREFARIKPPSFSYSWHSTNGEH